VTRTAHQRRHDVRAARAAARVAAQDLRRAVGYGFGALVALSVGSAFGSLQGRPLHQKLTALIAALTFLLLAVLAVRATARGLAKVVSVTGGRAAGAAFSLVTLVIGYVLTFFIMLGMLSVPLDHLLLGGAVTGVIVGIAAQQSLGNVFAGIVLLITRVFRVGDKVRIRSGPLGGKFDGVITGVGLTYLTIETDEGPLNVPNSAILSAANMGSKSTPGAENAPHYGQVWAGMAGPLPVSASPYRLPEVTSAGR